MPLIDHIPPKCKISLKIPGNGTTGASVVEIELKAIIAAGDDADQMIKDFTVSRQVEVETALNEARMHFLKSEAWHNVETLREKLAQVKHIEQVAQQALNNARAEFQEALLRGDETSLLSHVTTRSNEWNIAKQGYEELNAILTQCENDAQNKLREAIKTAHLGLQMQAGAEFGKLLDQLVAAINKEQIVALAVLENIAISGMPSMPAPAGQGAPDVPTAGGFDIPPPRPPAIPGSLAPLPTRQPTVPVQQFGPSGVEYAPDRPPNPGPSGVEQIV